MNKTNKIAFYIVIPIVMIAASIYVISQSFSAGKVGEMVPPIAILLVGIIGLAVGIKDLKYSKAAGIRLKAEFSHLGIDESNLPAIETTLYDKAANAIAFVTKIYLERKMLPDEKALLTDDAYQKVSNSLKNLDNPVYERIKNFADSVAKFKYAGLTMESMEEFHMNYLLGKTETTQTYDAKMNLSVANMPVASVNTHLPGRIIRYSKPVGKIIDIQDNDLYFTISYSTKNSGKTEFIEEKIQFNISDFNNPKVSFISNQTQVNNLFLYSSTPQDSEEVI